MSSFIRIVFLMIMLAGNFLNFAAADHTIVQGPEFVDAESVSEGFRNTADAIVSGFNSGDIQGVATHFDFEKAGAIAGKDLFNTDREYREFIKGITGARRNVLLAMIKQIDAADGEMILTGYVKRPLGVMPQIRIDMGDHGIDYIEYQLERGKDGHYRVIDWYQLSTGRMFSESIGIASRVMIDPNPNMLKKLLGITEVDHDVVDVVKAIGEARRRADYVEANRLLESLSLEIRKTRIFLELGIGFANLLGDDALYKERLQMLADNHGDDPSAAFLLIDHFYYQGDADKALANIEIMEQQIGKDGYTAFLRANLFYELAKDAEKAKTHYWEAIDIEPSLEDPYHTLAYVYILESDFANAVDVYRLLERNFGVQYSRDDFYDTPEVNTFKASTEFQQWMSDR